MDGSLCGRPVAFAGAPCGVDHRAELSLPEGNAACAMPSKVLGALPDIDEFLEVLSAA